MEEDDDQVSYVSSLINLIFPNKLKHHIIHGTCINVDTCIYLREGRMNVERKIFTRDSLINLNIYITDCTLYLVHVLDLHIYKENNSFYPAKFSSTIY